MLRFVAELSEVQVADLLERPVGTVPSRFSEVDFRIARETIEVPPPPYDAVVRRATDAAPAAAPVRRGRPRGRGGGRRRAGLGLDPARSGAGAAGGRRVGEPDRPAPGTAPAGCTFRTSPSTCRRCTDLVAVAGGVVYADDDGVLVYVGPAGEPTEIGRKSVGAPVVASDERSWVAWVDERRRPAAGRVGRRRRLRGRPGRGGIAAPARSRSTRTGSTTSPRGARTPGSR